MEAGATTCLIELSPWLGGQVSAQGVTAIDESLTMRDRQNFSPTWQAFKQLIASQSVPLPAWTGVATNATVADTNRCWVGHLCFPPRAGAIAAHQWLEMAQTSAPDSRWQTQTAFKGAEFSPQGDQITAVYGVQRISQDPDYAPRGRLAQELPQWYSWSEDQDFAKAPIRLQAPPGQTLVVIDATDTGELVGWANLPHRLGSESHQTTGELNAADWDNPDCTQAFTFPFAVALHDADRHNTDPVPWPQLQPETPGYAKAEHQRTFNLEGFPLMAGRSFFHYRRMVSTTLNDPFVGVPSLGDITLVNWTYGNDWNWMNPPLIFSQEKIVATGQRQNWQGGISTTALHHAQDHALLFGQWLLETQSSSEFPLMFLAGAEMPMGTESGLSIVPYIREGRRILGRQAYGQREFMMQEGDVRLDQEGRDFGATLVGITHYDLDIHGCRYRNWEPSGEAGSAPAREFVVSPVEIPLESLIPQEIDNLLIGGKAMAVSHIVNALTRIHYSEWTVGSAAGATAGWLVTEAPGLAPAEIVEQGHMTTLQNHLVDQGLRLDW
jgi:hypothetical protein